MCVACEVVACSSLAISPLPCRHRSNTAMGADRLSNVEYSIRYHTSLHASSFFQNDIRRMSVTLVDLVCAGSFRA